MGCHTTVGYYRSALSMTLTPVPGVRVIDGAERVDGVVVGQHSIVSRLLKGAYHSRPPQPRYSSTWNVQTVLELFRAHSPSSAEEPLKALTLRLAMLLTLSGARRCS